MSNTTLRNIILAGIFAVPFVPFIIASSLFFPFITGKAFIFRLLVEIMFVSYLILAIRDAFFRPRFSWILGTILIFLAAIGIADIFAVNPSKAFWSNFERMEGYVTLLHLVAYFVVMGSVLKTQEIWNKLLATSLFASFVMSVYSLFQIAGKIPINQGGVRVDGTLGNASYLAIYLLFHIFFAALLFVRHKRIWQRSMVSLVGVLNLIVLYYTATRGAVIGLLGGAFVTFLFLAWKSEKGAKIRKVATFGLMGLVAVIVLFFSFRNSDFVRESPVLSRFASLSVSELQTQGRYYVWPMALKGFVENPILGWGQEGFNFVFNKYYDPRMYAHEPWFDRAHNTFLDWLVAGGALGFVSYISIISSLLYYIFKANDQFLSREDRAIILGVVSAYLFNNLFVFDQISSYILFFTVLAYVHAHTPEGSVSIWEKISSKFKNVLDNDKAKPIYESMAVIVVFVAFYFMVFTPWKDNKELLEVLKLNNQGTVGSIEAYSEPLSGYSMAFPESLEHISQVSISMASNASVPNEFRQDLFGVVDKAFQKQIEIVPNDARYRLFYALFLSRYGWYGRAIEQLEIAKSLSPNKQSIYFELANNYALDNKQDQALAAAKSAYDLEPSYPEAKLVYGLMATVAGNPVLGNQILGEIEESKVIFDDRYLSVLLSMGQYEKIIELAKRRIELDPANTQHRITLTAAYLQANRRSEAISTIEELIKIDPSFKEKGEYYISEIRAGRNP